MKIKTQVVIALLVFLLSIDVATAQPLSSPPTSVQPTPSPSPQPLPTLSHQQREEVQELIEEGITESNEIRDRVQSEVNNTFGWTISLINLLITVLIAIPIVTGLVALFLRRIVIDQLVRETKKQLQEETEKEVKQQLEAQVAAELKIQVKAFKQELETLKLSFISQLQNLFLAAQAEKDQIFQELERITPSVIQAEFVTPEVQQKIQELTRQLELLKSDNPQLFLTADDYVNQGDAFYFEERYQDAIASYEKAIQINSNDFAAWLGRGKALRRSKRYEEALECNNKAIEINPDDFGGWFGHGYALRGLKRFEEALISYDKAVQLKPDSYYGWNHRAYTLTKLGRYEEALSSFEKALELKPKPNFATVYYNKSYYYILQNQIELAIEHLKQAIVLYPKLKETVKIDPDFNAIWEDERFKQLTHD